MDDVIRAHAGGTAEASADNPTFQAYQILHWGFVALPALAGIDKFTGLLTNWDHYLAPSIARLLPFRAHVFMMLVGVVEMIAALVVAVRPRVGAYVVAAWLGGIIVDLALLGGALDIALRDFGLFLAAIALGRLSAGFASFNRPLRTT